MAQIIFRRNGWYSDFRLNDKRIQRFLSKNKRDAQIELGKLISGLKSENSGRPSFQITWKAFKARYLSYCEGNKKPQSVQRDKAAISALEKTFPLERLSQINPELLEHWKAKRLKSGKGKPTVNRDLSAMKALLHKAEAWGYMETKNWKSVKKLKTTKKSLYFHTPEELQKLIDVCHGVWRTICLLGARAGLRREEIYTLTWGDIDFNRERIHISPKDGWEPKDFEKRIIGMPPDLTEHLKHLKRYDRWVISTENGSRPRLSVMSAYFQKLSRKVGLRGSLHILRHTYASHLIQAGVDLKTVKDLLGHSSMETTEIYAELLPEHLDRAALKLPPITLKKY